MSVSKLRNLAFKQLLVLIITIESVIGHGRLMEPPNRSSLWRVKEFESFNPEKNYDDNQLWCGGMGSQYNLSGGKCGPCGDEYIKPRPRENENGGIYGRGIITRTYLPEQIIAVGVELTVNHLGYFLFNLCPLPETLSLEEEECFDKYPLELADGSGYKYVVPSPEIGYYSTKVKLPKGLTTKHAVIRWHYRTGNRWNFDKDNNTGGLGIGDQEIFRGCSDVQIGKFTPSPVRPPMPGTSSSSTTSQRPLISPVTTTTQPTIVQAPTHRPPKVPETISTTTTTTTENPSVIINRPPPKRPHPIMRPPEKREQVPIIISNLIGSIKNNNLY